MRVIDTSVWIEWLTQTPLAAVLAPFFPGRDRCIVPTIVQLELAKWLRRECDDATYLNTIGYTNKCHIVALDSRLALFASELHRKYRLATADAIIYATAVDRHCELLTCDAHFQGLPHVLYFQKN